MLECFASVLFPLLRRLRCEALSPDTRIALAAAQYAKVVKETVGLERMIGDSDTLRPIWDMWPSCTSNMP